MTFDWGETSKKRAEGVDPQLWECATRALHKCKENDMTIQWRGGVRTAVQQKERYDRGASSKDGTNKLSWHQSGLALDVRPVGLKDEDLEKMVKGEIVAHPGFREFAFNMITQWQYMIKAGDAVGSLQWGGLWKRFIDLPHWQVLR